MVPAEGRHGAASPSVLSKMYTCSKINLCMKLFTDNIISRKYSKINNVYANMQTCKHFIFCKKILGQDLKSGHLLEIEKKENMQKTFFLHFCKVQTLPSCLSIIRHLLSLSRQLYHFSPICRL